MAETALQKHVTTVAEFIRGADFTEQLQLALPRGMSADRFARIVWTEVRKNPKLQKCTLESLAHAALQCAQVGLEPGFGLCSIIPYKDQATYQLEYKGLYQLIWRSAMVAGVQAEVVCENDEFEYSLGHPFVLKHKPAEQDRGERTHAWAIISLKNGGIIPKVMNRGQIEAIRDRYSQAWNRHGEDSPWGTAPDPMWCKTVLKQAGKLAPISAEAHAAITADDLTEVGIVSRPGLELPMETVHAQTVDQLNDMVESARQANGETPEDADQGQAEPAEDDSGHSEQPSPQTEPAPVGTPTIDREKLKKNKNRPELWARIEEMVHDLPDPLNDVELARDVALLIGDGKNSYAKSTQFKAADLHRIILDFDSFAGFMSDEMNRRAGLDSGEPAEEEELFA